jgi:hypothetical protein
MKTAHSLALISVWTICGCYDFTASNDDHTITDLKLLAIHTDPPYLKPGEPLTAEALVADPKGGGRTVSCAWKIDYFDQNIENADHPTVLMPSKSEGTRIALPPIQLRLGDKYTSPLFSLEVFACGGEMRDPARIADSTDRELLKTLCKKGPAVVAEKFLTPLETDLKEIIGISADNVNVSFNQNNPRVDRLTVNGIEVTAKEDGGGGVLVCDKTFPCDEPLKLAAYLELSGIDICRITSTSPDAGVSSETDATDESDTGSVDASFAEQHRIDWWVTGGSLSLPWSFISSAGDDHSHSVEDIAGPYQTLWRLPSSGSSAKYTLYVVARDLRGGNGWKTYDFFTTDK